MLVDTHTHAWTHPSVEHPWVNDRVTAVTGGFSVDLIYTAEKLLRDMDRHGVDRAVLVAYALTDWHDNSYPFEAIETSDRLDAVVMLDPFAEDAAARLREAVAREDVLGFRLGGACPYDRMWRTFDRDADWLERSIDETDFWEAAVETDAVVQLLVHDTQLDQAIELAESYPELRYLFDHFALADPGEPPGESAFGRFAELAEYDAAVKISEAVHRSTEGFPYPDVHGHVRWLLETFGRERTIWGSDYPNVSDEASYAEAIHWIEQVDGVDDETVEWLHGRAFEEFLAK